MCIVVCVCVCIFFRLCAQWQQPETTSCDRRDLRAAKYSTFNKSESARACAASTRTGSGYFYLCALLQLALAIQYMHTMLYILQHHYTFGWARELCAHALMLSNIRVEVFFLVCCCRVLCCVINVVVMLPCTFHSSSFQPSNEYIRLDKRASIAYLTYRSKIKTTNEHCNVATTYYAHGSYCWQEPLSLLW